MVETEPGTTQSIVARKPIRSTLKDGLAEVGEITRFAGKTLRELPEVRRFATEVIHQACILVLSSGLIIWAMQGVIGTMCGTEGSYTLKQIGAPLYSGAVNAWCGLREMAPYMWAYIFAAKFGCGLVAEIGSMRITDEIDAMEVMGIRPLSYLVGTRFLAAWLAIPFLFIVGLGCMYVTMYLTTVVNLKGVSPGGYLYMFWLFQTPGDLLCAMTKVMSMGTTIVFVSCYYGFTACGGPVGVGRNTARAMMVNMILIHLIGVITSQLF